jgi:histidine kinase
MFEVPGHVAGETVHHSSKSIILRATEAASGRRVFIKRLAEDLPSPGRIARLRREFDMTRRVAGPGINEALDLRRVGSTLVMVVEDFGGRALSRILGEGPLSLEDALSVCARVARALGAMHQRRLIHKDVNPSNIVWNPATGDVKLIDLGIATELSRERPEVLSPNVLEGTLAYMSPEQTGRMNRALD